MNHRFTIIMTVMALVLAVGSSSAQEIREVGFYDMPGAVDEAVCGEYAYVTSSAVVGQDRGLSVIDISDPQHPTEVGFCNTQGGAWGVAVAGDYAYVAGWDAGLCVIDISNPEHPNEVGICDTPGRAFRVAVAGGYACVADAWEGLRVIDITNPAHPDEVGFYDTPDEATDVAVLGSYAYVADGSASLYVIDISDPRHPEEVGWCDTPNSAIGVVVAGNYAYVGDWGAGLRVIDISDPQHPYEVGFCDTPGTPFDVAVAGDYVYVADEKFGLFMIDISDPQHPDLVGSYEASGYGSSYGVAVAGGYAYLTDTSTGLFILDVSDFTASPQDRLQRLIDQVADLVSVGRLNRGQGHALTATLAGAIRSLDREQYIPAMNQINAFIHQVEGFIAGGRLEPEEGQPLIDAATFILEMLHDFGIYDDVEMGPNESGSVPSDYYLSQNYPNPFNAVTKFSYGLPEAVRLSIRVYDVAGHLVTTLVNGYQSAGHHTATWDARSMSSGVYLVRMESASFSSVRKVMLVR